MPIPETPYTREEAYLNAIATGDSSGIPETPYTREEMYLDYIARNGGGGGGGGSSTLAGLTDVDISNPTDGQTLVYNATSGKWENGAGGPLIVRVNDQGVLDKTWQEIHDCAPLVWVEGSINGNPAYLPLYMIGTDSGSYFCVFPSAYSDPEMLRASTNTPNGYPAFEED